MAAFQAGNPVHLKAGVSRTATLAAGHQALRYPLEPGVDYRNYDVVTVFDVSEDEIEPSDPPPAGGQPYTLNGPLGAIEYTSIDPGVVVDVTDTGYRVRLYFRIARSEDDAP